MTSQTKINWKAGLFEVLAAVFYFIALAVLLLLWQPGREGWGFLVHLLVNAALAAALFAFRLSGLRLRRPFSAPEIFLVLLFLYAIINACLSSIKYPALEQLPFYLDGLLLFYLGASLFSRRFEGVLLIFIIFAGGLILLSSHLGQTNLWKIEGSASSFYRGKQMLWASLFERPLWGSGNGALPHLMMKYLPLPNRYPPIISYGYGKIPAETGLVGAVLWLGFLLSLFLNLLKGRSEKSPDKSAMRLVGFWFVVFFLLGLLIAGFSTPLFAAPTGFFLLLPLAGMAATLRRGSSPPPEQELNTRITPGFSFIVLFPLLLITGWESIPPFAACLAQFQNVKELGTEAFGTRISLATRLMPQNPNLHLVHAKHLRALPEEGTKWRVFQIEAAYLRALHQNRFNERAYLEYGHFLDLIEDYGSLVSLLEQGNRHSPGSVEITLFLFRGYMREGRRREALDLLQSLEAFYPIDFATQERIGKYYAEADAMSASQEAFILAAQINPAFYLGKKSR